jgi:hypothetical protein
MLSRRGNADAYDEAAVERIRKLLARRRDVAEKRLMGGICFTLKGNMCCAVSVRGGILVRVGAPAYPRMLVEPHVEPLEMRGRPVNGFVRVGPEGYRTDATLKKWVQRGVDFVSTLPAKPARKTVSRKTAVSKARARRNKK